MPSRRIFSLHLTKCAHTHTQPRLLAYFTMFSMSPDTTSSSLMAAKSDLKHCCPEEKSVANPPVGPEEVEDRGCRIPTADGGTMEWEREELVRVMGWRRPLPAAAGTAEEGGSSPLWEDEEGEREEAGLGCRTPKEELGRTEGPANGVGCSRPAPPPPDTEDWRRLEAMEVGGAE